MRPARNVLSRAKRLRRESNSRRPAAVVCSIGSVDPLNAAGLGADLRVYALLNVQAALVVTAVTAQNNRAVHAVRPLPASAIREQLQAIWEQVRPDAVCIGLVPHPQGLRAVRTFLGRLNSKPPIVLDPVAKASNGSPLSFPAARVELLNLLPFVSVVTPNAAEAQRLSGVAVSTHRQAVQAALKLSRRGCAVLLTGGHVSGTRCVDVLARVGEVRTFSHARQTAGMRGSGGVLAAALSAYLGMGFELESAIAHARRFVAAALRGARAVGDGDRQLWAAPSAGDNVKKRSTQRNR